MATPEPETVQIMGFLFAALATVIAAVSAGLASFFGAPIALSLALVAVSYVACAIPVIKYGHRNFGGGGNTDLVGYVFVVLVVTAIAIPRLAPDIEDESSDPGPSPGDRNSLYSPR